MTQPPATAQINAVSVETPYGFRTFELYSGSVLEQRTDLLVISTHHNLLEAPTGKLVSSLRKQFQFPVDVSEPWINFGQGVTACVQQGTPQVPFQWLLTMRIAKPSRQADPMTFYDRAIQATFAAIATLECMGHTLTSVSLPVLSGQRIAVADYPAAVQSLLKYACAWLRQSRQTNVVRYFVFEPEQLEGWDRAINESLGRSYVDSAHEFVARSLCQEIVAKLDGDSLAGPLEELRAPLRHALANPQRLSVQTIATFGRKLAEQVTEQVCGTLRLPVQRELMNNIEAVRQSKAVADWIISYLHSLRVFGNEGVHSLAGKRSAVPSELSAEDLVAILSALRAVISFWAMWRQRQV